MRLIACLLALIVAAGTIQGCSKPSRPSLTGPGKFQDISQVRKGMSNNEVERIMGKNYKLIYEEGIHGMDGGNYIWEYSSGRVYFGIDGVTRVARY